MILCIGKCFMTELLQTNSLCALKNVVPFFNNYVPAGFPSPAESYVENNLNLHDHLVKKPSSTFFVRAIGDSMIGVGIYPKDLLVVDRSLEPNHRSIVIAVVNGEFTLKRLIKTAFDVRLRPENSKYSDIIINSETQFEVWGVVTHNVHDLRSV